MYLLFAGAGFLIKRTLQLFLLFGGANVLLKAQSLGLRAALLLNDTSVVFPPLLRIVAALARFFYFTLK
jgi:hypothetical protein